MNRSMGKTENRKLNRVPACLCFLLIKIFPNYENEIYHRGNEGPIFSMIKMKHEPDFIFTFFVTFYKGSINDSSYKNLMHMSMLRVYTGGK